MTTFTKFLPKVRLEVAKCPRPVLIDAVREACIQFCDLSHWWKEQLDPISVTPSERAIEMEHPDDARVIRVLHATFDDEELAPIIPARADIEYPGWRVDNDGDPEVYFLPSLDEIRLAPHPDTDGELDLYVVLRPSETSLSIADRVFEEHYSLIATGAKAILMAQVNVPWSLPARAKQLADDFDSKCRGLNINQAVGHTRARLRTTVENR